jgi:hypothetical protein
MWRCRLTGGWALSFSLNNFMHKILIQPLCTGVLSVLLYRKKGRELSYLLFLTAPRDNSIEMKLTKGLLTYV